MPREVKSTEKTSKTPSRTSRVTKNQAVKYLSRVPEDKVFWCTDGQILKDMNDLRDSLTNMSDQTFTYHSNEMKQDFSVWIREIVGDEKLANDLESASTRERALFAVESRCDLLSSKIK